MAESYIIDDANLLFGAGATPFDASDYVRTVTLTVSRAEHDRTVMGAGGVLRKKGLETFSLTIEFVNSYADDELNEYLYNQFKSDYPTRFELSHSSAAISASNPEWSGDIIVSQWNPIGTTVGDLAMTTVTFPGDGAVTQSYS